MKAILEFNLPKDNYEHNCAIKGKEYRRILWEIAAKFREKWKYEDAMTTSWDKVYDELWDIFKDFNFDPFEED